MGGGRAVHPRGAGACRRVLGDDHPSTLTAISNMGVLLAARGKLAEAEPYFRESLASHRRVLGDDHPDTLGAIDSMSGMLLQQGKLAEAEPYSREVLERRRRVLGDDHPDTLQSITMMSKLLRAQGKFAEAEPFGLEVLERCRRVLGDDHPQTLDAIGNMGNQYWGQGKLAEAEPYYREALERSRRVLGNDHPHTQGAVTNMGGLLEAQGKLAEAEPYCREAVESFRRILGDDHRLTLAALRNMGGLLQQQGKLTEAETYYREALERRRRVLGDDHHDTLASLFDFCFLLRAQGKSSEAIALLVPAEPAMRRAFARGVVPLGVYLTLLGRCRSATSDFAAAQTNLTEAYAILSEDEDATARNRNDVLDGLVELYESWHAAEPDQGHDEQAAQWRAKLAEWQASTQPATSCHQRPGLGPHRYAAGRSNACGRVDGRRRTGRRAGPPGLTRDTTGFASAYAGHARLALCAHRFRHPLSRRRCSPVHDKKIFVFLLSAAREKGALLSPVW